MLCAWEYFSSLGVPYGAAYYRYPGCYRMNSCDNGVNLLRYLDNELSGRELQAFCAHLQNCLTCKVRIEEERTLSILLRRSRPLYRAPEGLRYQVSEILRQHPATDRGATGAYGRLLRILQRPFLNRWSHRPSWSIWTSTLVVVSLCLILVPRLVRRVHATGYVETAVGVHRSYLEGKLAPEIESDSPAFVTAWFAGKVPFDFRLPADRGGNPLYRLSGARLVSYGGHNAALVIYETQTDKISLLVASEKSATIAGGDEIRSGNLAFHYFSRETFKVITWSNHGLSYALVSSLSASARESRLICHQDMADREVFRTQP
jgi:anti-sigma factor RsiW